MISNLNWTRSNFEPNLIPVGEIDTHGRLFIDSYFHHQHNAENYARLLLKRGAYIVVVGGVVFTSSKLAQTLEAAAAMN